MDGSVLAFLKCTGGSVWTHLNGTYGSVLSHLRFSTQSAFTRFPQSGNSGDHCYYARKATKLPIWNRMLWLLSNTGKYSPNCRANTENQLFEYCPPRKDNTGSITFPMCSRYISPYIPPVNWSVGGGRCFGYRPNFYYSFMVTFSEIYERVDVHVFSQDVQMYGRAQCCIDCLYLLINPRLSGL